MFSHPAHGSGFYAWLRILSENRFAFHPFFLPKIFFISCTIVLSTPFRWYEKVRYRKILSKQKVNAPVFILGHPRSGTTFLHYLMSKDPAFAYCNTLQAMVPHLFLSGSWILRKVMDNVLPSRRPMDNLRMGSGLPKEEEFAMAAFGAESLVSAYYFPKNYIKTFKKAVVFDERTGLSEQNWKKNFEFLLRKLSFNQGGKTLLLKSPGNTGRIQQLLKLYPDAKFINICRNPYSVFQSNMHLYRKLLPLLSFQKINETEVKEFVLEGYEILMRKYFLDKQLLGKNNLIEISYEEFEKKPIDCLERIYSELKIGNFSEAKIGMLEELNSYRDFEKNRLTISEADKIEVQKRWGFAFEELGYPL